MKHFKSIVTLTLLILLASAGGVLAHQEATSDLLLPYFEVDLGGTGVKTIFSVINSSADPVPVNIKVFSNWGIEILTSRVTIAPDAVQMVDLQAWIGGGLFLDRTLDAEELDHVHAALTGELSPRDDLYYSTQEAAQNIAVGFVKIEGPSGAKGDVLFGEYFILDTEQDFAQGDFLVDIDQASGCPGLCKRHGVRFLAGGGFDSGTEVVIWTDYRGRPAASAYYPEANMTEADTMAYKENGQLIDHMGLSLRPLQVIKVSELGLSSPFGWLDLETDKNTLVTLRLSAANRFSVGFKTSCLPKRPPVDPDTTTLTLIKKVINDDGGTLGVADFPLFVDQRRVDSGVATDLQPGTYTASEENQDGYIAGTWGGDCAADGTVALALGDHKVCEIINDDEGTEEPPATLTLIKIVKGGTLGVADFALFAGDEPMTSGTARQLPAGTYSVREDNHGGYNPSGWTGDCSGPADSTMGSVTLAPGDNKVCEITNERFEFQPTTLTLIKRVINDHGGTLGVSDFPLFIDNMPVASGQTTEVGPGTFTAREENQAGYIAGTWGGDCAADGSVSLEEGDVKVCEITNNDAPPISTTLTLIKTVINDDGGTLGVHDFPLFIGDRQVTSGSANEVTPGSHGVREQNQAGYTAGAWGGDCSANGSVTLAAGEHKTCTITNDDDITIVPPASLTLIKIVINDDGGTLGVHDFPLYIDGAQVTSGVATELAAGTYTASEQNQAGYTAGAWSGDCSASGSVTLAAGEHKTCTITNDDDITIVPPASLTLIKIVINDDGGTLGVHDFPLYIDGAQVTSGVATELAAGTYTASEQNQDGYTAGAWSGDCSASGSVTLAAGEHKTCTITNDDDPVVVTPDRMTGGGSVFLGNERYTHGFELHCDASHPNNLEINWGNGKANRFHLTSLTFAECSDDPGIVEAPPVAGFDTFVGEGVGRFNGVDGATITFTFTDAGEPGKNDVATFTIHPPDGGAPVSVSGRLHNGNHQAHGK